MQKSEYRGLVNEGSTCYLNSLLQTLFMTPEFRQNVYNYVHDERKISTTDSIPYQLQKLFVLLQQNQASVLSKGLLRSFQWNQVDSFQQHDVQEFCRVLFEALEKASKGHNWLEKLYSGVMQSFISCGKHPRANQEVFMDISLPIKSPATQAYYTSIQQCLKEYLRPENLQDKIQCEGCGQKVQVQKGLRLTTVPPILTLQVNRFQLNYNTMQREKVNSFLYFPQILELWRFMVPFEQIVPKGIPKDFFDKVKLIEKQKSARETDWGFGGLSVTGKGITKKKSFEIEAEKKQTKFYDEENRDKRQDETKKLSVQEQKMKNLQILKDLKADKQKFDKKSNKNQSQQSKQLMKQKENEQKHQDKKEQKQKVAEKPGASSIEDDMLFGSFMDGFDRSGNEGLNQFENIEVSNSTNKGKAGPKFQKTQAIFQHAQQAFDVNKQYPHNTYVLFSVLVHSGGAYGGHYYAYIFNGVDWYCFNDNNVRKVARQQIRKYGHPYEETSYGANAYLLFYREAKQFKNILKQTVQIPSELLEKVKNDKTIIPETKPSKQTQQLKNRFNQLDNTVVLKIKYKSDRLQTLIVPNRRDQTVSSVKKLVKQNLNVTEQDQNWRLRRYNKTQDTMHEVYDGQLLNKTLEEIGLRQTWYMIIQTKSSEDSFVDYDPKNIFVKLNVWRESLTLLTQSHLKPIKLGIRQEKTFEQFYHRVEQSLKIKNPLIIKRNFSVGNPYQIFQLEANKNKTLLSMRFFNGINLYVEEPTQQKPKWQKQFQDERHKCQIKFNNPKQGIQKNNQIYFDNRKTLGQLKKRIAEIIGLSAQDFRIKKSQQSISEMTAYRKRLIDLRFISNEYLFIEEGKSSRETIIIRKGIVSTTDDQILFQVGEEMQVEIEDNSATVADLNKKISQKYNIPQFYIRVRQFSAHQFGQIFEQTQHLTKIKQKSLVWEQLQIQDPKSLQLYARVFNVMTLQLGPLQTIFMQRNGNYEQLALMLEQQTQIQSDKILAYKPGGKYVDKAVLFECEWVEIKYIKKPIRQQPLYLTKDGDILIIKQAEVSYHPRPAIRSEYYGLQNIISGVSGKSVKKEVGMKITVVEEKQETTGQVVQQDEEIIYEHKDSQQKVKNNENFQQQQDLTFDADEPKQTTPHSVKNSQGPREKK